MAHSFPLGIIELQSRRLLQAATGGTRGESVLATQDGRLLVAQTQGIDELAPARAPHVVSASAADGALLALPAQQISVSFDQAMWGNSGTGDGGANAGDPASVLRRSW